MISLNQSSWKAKRDRLIRSDFIGRYEQLTAFRASVTNPDAQTMIFAISGQGGVGKTTLLKEFRRITQECKYVAAYIDEGSATNRVEDVPEALHRLAKDFEAQNASYKFEKFQERYKTYRQKRQELEADPEAPSGIAAGLGQAMTKLALGGVKDIPVLGGMVDAVMDRDATAEKGGELIAFAWKKLRNQDEVQLVTEPLEVLTPLFIEELNRIAAQQRVVLLLDTYEITGKFLDDWLRAVLDCRYGDLTGNFRICIAGRDPLDRNAWAELEPCIARSPLEPFTQDEARHFLTTKGINSEDVIQQIWQLSSDGLPLLVSMMAENAPKGVNAVVDPCDLAVERFLKWETDAGKRQLAQDGALPRVLNADVVAVLEDGQFDWLKDCSFVVRDGEQWRYHLVVREQMLRYHLQISRQRWNTLHSKLAAYYDQLRQNLGLEVSKAASDETWREYSLEWLYHELCAAPQAKLDMTLNGFLRGLKTSWRFAQEWATVMAQAGKEANCEALQEWGERLRDGMLAHKDKRYTDAISALTRLLAEPGIEEPLKAVAFNRRGRWHRLSKQEELALPNFQRAVEIDPRDSEHWLGLGITCQKLRRYEEAIAAYQQAIQLDHNAAYLHNNLGNVYRDQNCYEKAISAYQQAIQLDPNFATPHYNLGIVYFDQKRYDEAIAAYQQAIQLDPKFASPHNGLGNVYKDQKRYEKAILAYQQAIQLDPNNAYPHNNLGIVYADQKRYDEAIAAYQQTTQLDPEYEWAWVHLGLLEYEVGNYEAALNAFQKALGLQPDSVLYSSNLGYLHLLQSNVDQAQELITFAIQKEPFARTWLNLGLIQALQNQLEAAQQSWQQGLSLMEDDEDWNKAVHYVFKVALGNAGEGLKQMQELIHSGADQFALQNALNDATILSRVSHPIEGIDQMIQLLKDALFQV